MTTTEESVPVQSTRIVAQTVDTPRFYGSAAAAGGGFAFFAGTAIDAEGGPAPDAEPAAQYGGSATARAHLQTRSAYRRVAAALDGVGSSIRHVLQVEQYVERKVQAEAYFAEALRPEFLDVGTVNGATAQVGGYLPKGCSVSVLGMAVSDRGDGEPDKHLPGRGGSPTGKYADVLLSGPYLFTTVFAMVLELNGLPPDVRLPDWSWGGSEVASEAKWAFAQLEKKLATVGSTLADVVDYTLFLSDLDDLYEFDVIARAAWSDEPPTRTVILMRGSALPRRERAVGHAEGAARIELQFRCLNRSAEQAGKLVVAGADSEIGYQSAAVQVDRLLWLSSCSARDGAGDSIAAEVADVLAQLAQLCDRAGTSLANALRLRVQLTDADDAEAVFTALRAAIPTAPPAVSVVIVDGLPIPGRRIAVDGVILLDATR